MSSSLVQGIPAQVLSLIQEGLIERQFYDGLYPNLAYRAEFEAEKWEGQTGTQILMTRPGLLAPNVTPLVPGEEPQPKNVPYEQWTMQLDQYADAIDTNMVNSAVANSNLFIRNIHQLGLGAGQSINRIARNVMFKTYLSGQTNLLAQAAAGTSSVRVASLNGFTDVLIAGGSQVRPQPVSPAFPLPVTFGANATLEVKSVIAATPDTQTDPFGPGTLTLSAPLTNTQAIRAAAVSAYAPRVVRASGGSSIDAISASDTLSLQQIINAVAILRNARVQPHEDGTFHAHLNPLSQAQVYADPVFQKLNQSLPDGPAYKEGYIGEFSGVSFFMNVESPNLLNSGTLTATSAATGAVAGASAKYGSEIGAEVMNGFGVAIGRVLITGKGAGYERYLDEAAYVTEAGTTGKIGEFDVVNDGMSILTERIRLVIRAPQDRLQQKVGAAWSITTGFACPSDITAPSGPERFKRALILEHAM
jgi:hypothetical protein